MDVLRENKDPVMAIMFVATEAKNQHGHGRVLSTLEQLRGLVPDPFLQACLPSPPACLPSPPRPGFHPKCKYGSDARCSVERPSCKCREDRWNELCEVKK